MENKSLGIADLGTSLAVYRETHGANPKRVEASPNFFRLLLTSEMMMRSTPVEELEFMGVLITENKKLEGQTFSIIDAD